MRRGQVWIETVLYTLIGIALIGVVLAFVTPKINQQKDNLLIQQTIQSLDSIDQKISAVLQAPGNSRQIQFSMKRGSFYINSTEDSLIFIIDDLSKPYSEPGVEIPIGRINLLTQEDQNSYSVILKINYNEDIRYNLEEENQKLDPVAIPYRISISNEGIIENGGRTVININEVSG